jgi:LmbE family N-acetylglucosaminyl deacetylase
MPPKRNPLGLNPLQLKTLTLLQAIARLPDLSRPGDEPGTVVITALPHAHGDHFHLGEAVVAARDATGLNNPAVWTALARKGLVRPPQAGGALLTAAGIGYDTGLADAILHKSAD